MKNLFEIGETVLAEVVVKNISVDKDGDLEYTIGKVLDGDSIFDSVRVKEDMLTKK